MISYVRRYNTSQVILRDSGVSYMSGQWWGWGEGGRRGEAGLTCIYFHPIWQCADFIDAKYVTRRLLWQGSTNQKFFWSRHWLITGFLFVLCWGQPHQNPIDWLDCLKQKGEQYCIPKEPDWLKFKETRLLKKGPDQQTNFLDDWKISAQVK